MASAGVDWRPDFILKDEYPWMISSDRYLFCDKNLPECGWKSHILVSWLSGSIYSLGKFSFTQTFLKNHQRDISDSLVLIKKKKKWNLLYHCIFV